MFNSIEISKSRDNHYIITLPISEVAAYPIKLTHAEVQYIIDHWVIGIRTMKTQMAGDIVWFFDTGSSENIVVIAAGNFYFRYDAKCMQPLVEKFAAIKDK